MYSNGANLEPALNWLKNLIEGCLKLHFKQSENFELEPLKFYESDLWLSSFIKQYQLGIEEFVVLMFAAVPHLQPDFFNKLIAEYLPEGGDFPAFGGVKGANHRGILPTGETVQFILAGGNIEKRLEVQRVLSREHWFTRRRILWLESVREGEPMMSGRLTIRDHEMIELMTVGTVRKPRFSHRSPDGV